MCLSVCAEAQAGLRLCCSQTPEDRFSLVEAHIIVDNILSMYNVNISFVTEQLNILL